MLTWKPIGRPSLAATLRAERRRLERAAMLLVLGLLSVVGAGLSDLYIHRGLEVATDDIRLQPVGRQQGTNIDLRRFPDDDLDGVMEALRAGRLSHVRQLFSWADIEPTQGTFRWERYDAITVAAARAGIVPIVVLGDTPAWARSPEASEFVDAPPRSTAAFAAYCDAIRARYPDLRFFQVGQALDDPARWGGRAPDPNEYAALLTVASDSLRVGASERYLVAGEISSTLDARRSGADLETIETVLGHPRVAQLVDVVAVVADGGTASPFDRRMAADVPSLSRTIMLREALLGEGYDDKAIWLTRLGWSGDGGAPVDVERQAELVAAGLRRIRSEWPWVDLVLAWEFVADPESPVQGVALVEGNTPTDLFAAFAAFSATPFGQSATAGLNAASSPACTFEGSWPEQHLERRLSKISRDPEATATCRFWGSGVSLISRYSPSSGAAWFRIDGRPAGSFPEESGWSVVPLRYVGEEPVEAAIPLASNLASGPHTLTVRLGGEGELVFGGIVVGEARTMVWPVALLLLAGLLALVLALRDLMTLLAEHLDLLQRRRGVTLQPALPRLSDWRPDARLRGR